MDNEQMLCLLNSYFDILETYGKANDNDLVTIIYLMFMLDYYDNHRNISLQDLDNDEIGLTECMVRKLNMFMECLKNKSGILQCVNIDYFPTKYHWIIPDVEEPDTPDEPEIPDEPDIPDTPDNPDNPDDPDVPDTPDTPDIPVELEYIENKILYVIGVIGDNELSVQHIITNNILQI